MVKFLKNCLVVLVVLVFLATSSINKANLSCEGLFDGEEESINISLLLYSWWHPTSFLRGDFLDGRWGTASVHMYGKLNEKNPPYLGLNTNIDSLTGVTAHWSFIIEKMPLTVRLPGWMRDKG
jgi:hypothetical protein